MDAKEKVTEPVQFKRWQLWAMRLSIISAIAHIPTAVSLFVHIWPF
jgi:hypothetical protein